MNIENIKTDNIPLLDELVYNLKILLLTSVVKDESKALKYETMESIKSADRYISCIEGNARFEMLEYNRELLLKSSIPYYLIEDCVKDKYKIPYEKRNEVLKLAAEDIIKNYNEINYYYRTLCGLPEIGKQGIKITKDYLPLEIQDIDVSKYLHELDNQTVDLLYSMNVIDRVIEENPTEKYLNYMGSKRITPYKARKASNFSLLYTSNMVPSAVLRRFKDKYEINRNFTLKTVYSDVFKMGSDYYDNFIQIFILIQTMVDIIGEMPDMIVNKEIFDLRMIELVFKSHGVDFFPEIPFKYQLAMVKNINKLIKYKSTTINIVDICSLFGFDNVEVFKYYLLKNRKVDKNGNYIFEFKEDENGNMIEDDEKNYELKFLKVPINDIPDNYIYDQALYMDYDDVVAGDKYWNGDLPHDFVKSSIIKKEFNYIQSKYLSVDSIYTLTNLSFQLIYFHNMIFDNHKVEELLLLRIPTINSVKKFRFIDVFCFLYALMYEYNNIEDDIMDTPTKIMQIKGFNFKADMEQLGNYVKEKGFTLEELGVSDFQIPNSQVLTYNQLMYIFTKNKQIHDHLVKQISTADNKKIYDIYYKIYDSLMLCDLTKDFFTKSDGTMATSYTDYLEDKDPILHSKLLEIKEIDSLEPKRYEINQLVNDIVYIIETELESDDFKFIFSILPSTSTEAIKQYVYKVINFFKSYKVDFQSINTIYKFDDKLSNKIKMIDGILFNYIYTKVTTIESLSKIKSTSKLTKKEKIKLIDDLFMDITYWLDIFFNEDNIYNDKIVDKIINFIQIQENEINDISKDMKISVYKESLLDIETQLKQLLINLTKEEKIKLIDDIYINITYWLDKFFKDDIIIKEYLSSIIKLYKNDDFIVKDLFDRFISKSNKTSILQMVTSINKIQSSLDANDKILFIDSFYTDITYWLDKFFKDDRIINDYIKNKLIYNSYIDKFDIHDNIMINIT